MEVEIEVPTINRWNEWAQTMLTRYILEFMRYYGIQGIKNAYIKSGPSEYNVPTLKLVYDNTDMGLSHYGYKILSLIESHSHSFQPLNNMQITLTLSK